MTPIKLLDTPLYNDAYLIAYHRLEDVSDSKGSFTLTNNNSVSFSSGKFDNAADFGASNTNKSLTTTNTLGIDGGNISFVGWINVTTAPALGEAPMLLNQGNNTSMVRYLLYYENSGGTLQLTANRSKNGVSDNPTSIVRDLGTGIWFHVAMTYDGTNLIPYLNGSRGTPLATSGSGSGTNNTGYAIGAYLASGGNFFSGKIDDAAVFSRALTDTEIGMLVYGKTAFSNTKIRVRPFSPGIAR